MEGGERKNEVGGWGGAGCMREGSGKRGGMRVEGGGWRKEE